MALASLPNRSQYCLINFPESGGNGTRTDSLLRIKFILGLFVAGRSSLFKAAVAVASVMPHRQLLSLGGGRAEVSASVIAS